MCGTHRECHKQPQDVKCSCSWHVRQDSMEVSQLKRDVMR